MGLIQTEQKTGVRISQAVGISVTLLFGAAAAMLLVAVPGSKDDTLGQSTNATNTRTNTNSKTTNTSTAAVDLTHEALPPALTAATPAPVPSVIALDPTVSVKITSPLEGSQGNGDTSVTAALTDLNHVVTGIRIRLYGNELPDYMKGTSTQVQRTAPYTFNFNLGMYPSGEYRYVAEALIPNTAIPRTDDWTVVAASDTMTTWVRSCYYLGYPDVTLTGPTADVHPEQTVTLTATVKNNIRGNCVNNYTFTPTVPAGFFPPVLMPGATATFGINETKTITMSAEVTAAAKPGPYVLKFKAQRDFTGFIVEKSVTVNVVK